jgi:hypothetical protein
VSAFEGVLYRSMSSPSYDPCENSSNTDNVRCFDLGLSVREIGEKNFFLLAVFAGETEIPLAGG